MIRIIRIAVFAVPSMFFLAGASIQAHAQTGGGRSYDGPVTWVGPTPPAEQRAPAPEYCREHKSSKSCREARKRQPPKPQRKPEGTP